MDNNKNDNQQSVLISPVTGIPCPPGVKPDVLTSQDIMGMAAPLAKHPKLVDRLMHWFGVDEVNRIHSTYCHTIGPEFATHLVFDEFNFSLRVDNMETLEQFKEGAFITVSNHPFGAMDGIILLHLVGSVRPDFKVMVNMILNKISAMSPSFIAVDPFKSDDPEKKQTTMRGIRDAMFHLKKGHPLGFFPAGAVSKPFIKKWRVEDRDWQPSIIRLIKQMKVPVIPIFFHGRNSNFFQALGMIDWRLRTLRLPKELFRRRGQEIHISIGNPISPQTQAQFENLDELGSFLRQETYKLAKLK